VAVFTEDLKPEAIATCSAGFAGAIVSYQVLILLTTLPTMLKIKLVLNCRRSILHLSQILACNLG
jgi:hypothetical protein